MRRAIIVTFSMLFACLLCSCSLFQNGIEAPAESTDSSSADPSQEQLISVMNGNVDLDALSLDELLKLYDEFLKGGNDALNDGAENDLLYRDIDIKPNDPSAEIGFEYPTDVQTATYSDKEWEDKTFEALDPTANMSPDDKAGYEAAMQELEDFDAEEFQKGVDEMLKGIEGFEDYDPDDPEAGEDPDSQGTNDDPAILNEWPDNEITRQVPKPPFEDPMIVADDDSVTVMRTGSTEEEAKAYAKQLKDAGFNKDVNESTNGIAGFSIYTFTAENQNGLSVSLTFATGTTTVSFNKD